MAGHLRDGTTLAAVIWIGVVLLASIVVSLLRGGKLSNLAEIELHAWWLLFVGFGLQVVANALPDSRSALVRSGCC